MTETNYLYKAFKSIDIFGKMYSFERKGTQHNYTSLGGFFTVGIVIAVAIVGFLFGKEIYERKIPNSNFSEEMIETSRIDLNDIPIMFWFGLQGGRRINDISTVLSFKTKLHTFKIDLTSEEEFFPSLSPCVSDSFNNHRELIEEDIINAKVQNMDMLCLNTDPNMYFQNDYSSKNSTFVHLFISYCDPTQRECHPDLEIIKQGLFVKILTINSIIDPKNFEKPISYYKQILSEQVSDAMMKRIYLGFTRNILETDDGWILENKVYEEFFELRKIKQEVNKYVKSKAQPIWVTIESPNLRLRVVRHYLKIQELFAKIGGLFNALVIISKIVLSDYLNFNYYISIMVDLASKGVSNHKKNPPNDLSKNFKLNKSISPYNRSMTPRKVNLNNYIGDKVKEERSLGIKEELELSQRKKNINKSTKNQDVLKVVKHNVSKVREDIEHIKFLNMLNDCRNISYFSYSFLRISSICYSIKRQRLNTIKHKEYIKELVDLESYLETVLQSQVK